MIPYPRLDPIAFSLGPVQIHWYGITYLVGFLAAWWLARLRAARPGSTWKAADVDDLIFYCMLGVIVGGRLGYVFFYGLKFWGDSFHESTLKGLLYPFRVWEGGMAFHGGLLGVLLAMTLFAWRRGRVPADVYDFTVPLAPPGLFFGRIGNFINGELWGRPTTLPWGFDVNGVSRHPSQLYEALIEGLLLFTVLWWFTSRPQPRLAAGGLFLLIYGAGRTLIETVRLPDEHINYLYGGWLTEGMLLCLPMIIGGLVILAYAYRKRLPSGNVALAR
jgi:phosphatidylglycerol---prolipoprotein diacylglyceryl transferase